MLYLIHETYHLCVSRASKPDACTFFVCILSRDLASRENGESALENTQCLSMESTAKVKQQNFFKQALSEVE